MGRQKSSLLIVGIHYRLWNIFECADSCTSLPALHTKFECVVTMGELRIGKEVTQAHMDARAGRYGKKG
jgi:hypothetical protein